MDEKGFVEGVRRYMSQLRGGKALFLRQKLSGCVELLYKV